MPYNLSPQATDRAKRPNILAEALSTIHRLTELADQCVLDVQTLSSNLVPPLDAPSISGPTPVPTTLHDHLHELENRLNHLASLLRRLFGDV